MNLFVNYSYQDIHDQNDKMKVKVNVDNNELGYSYQWDMETL